MCLRLRKQQQGLGLVAAIFVITVMALVTIGLSNLVVTGQQSYGHELLSTRAFLAAESGAQIVASKILVPPATPVCAAPVVDDPVLPVGTTLPAPGLSGCSVEVSCTSFTIAETATTYYTLESEGRCGTGADLAVRRLNFAIQLPAP